LAASAAAVILAGGAAGRRFVLPHSRVMIHQPHVGGIEGQASDIEIQAREITHLKEEMVQILARHSGRPEEQVRADTDRDRWLTAVEAVEYGLADLVLAPSHPLGV
jgi:ATP-dependent Clp protease protease subunit